MSISESKPWIEYSRRLEERRGELAAFLRWHIWIGNARLAVLVAAVVTFWQVLWPRTISPW